MRKTKTTKFKSRTSRTKAVSTKKFSSRGTKFGNTIPNPRKFV